MKENKSDLIFLGAVVLFSLAVYAGAATVLFSALYDAVGSQRFEVIDVQSGG